MIYKNQRKDPPTEPKEVARRVLGAEMIQGEGTIERITIEKAVMIQERRQRGKRWTITKGQVRAKSQVKKR